MNRLRLFLSNNWDRVLTLWLMVISVVAYLYVRSRELLFIYDDGVSYLTIARSVVESAQPGPEQMGHIWLPVNHLLKLPFIWNDTLYHSGIAGSIISMVGFVILCKYVYKTVVYITNRRLHGTVAALVCALNPTVLYLQTTPMSEIPFMAMCAVSVYYFVKYIDTRSISSLAILGMINAVMVLTRYEGWAVVAAQVGMIAVVELLQKKKSLSELATRGLILLQPVGLALIAWLMWNNHLTGDPLAFMNSEFSAGTFTDRQQQFGQQIEGSVELTLLTFMGAAVNLLSAPVVGLATLGYSAWLIARNFSASGRSLQLGSNLQRSLVIAVLLIPAAMHIFLMFGGQTAMRVAGIAGSDTSLNLRYGIFLLPYVAIGVVMISRRMTVALTSGAIVAASYVLMVTAAGPLPIITDAQEGQIAYKQAAAAFAELHSGNEEVLVSMAANSAFTFHTELPMSTFIHEGVYGRWQAALENPETVDWVVKSRRTDFDTLSELDADDELTGFDVVYSNYDIEIYKRVSTVGISDER